MAMLSNDDDDEGAVDAAADEGTDPAVGSLVIFSIWTTASLP